MKKVIIAGSGLGGLSAAIHLAKNGYRVEIHDQRSGPGGKAFEERKEGFRFDTGPSLFTMKPIFQSLFEVAGKNIDDYLQLIPLKKDICHYFFDDGSQFRAPGSVEQLSNELVKQGMASEKNLRKFFDKSKKFYDRGASVFLYENIHEPGFFWRPDIWFKFSSLATLGPLSSMAQIVEKLFSDSRTRQLFLRYATYNGSHPWKTPGTLSLIPYVEYGLGAWDLVGGIYSLSKALHQVAEELGVQFHFQSEIKEFLRKQDRVYGIKTDVGNFEADAVISNIDVMSTYKLLGNPNTKWQKKYSKQEPSSSGFVFYLGVNHDTKDLHLHNILFSKDYKQEFEDIFTHKQTPNDPTFYINITSKTTKGDAPEGMENWFVLVNTPPDYGQDWESVEKVLFSKLCQRVNQHFGFDLEKSIKSYKTMNPKNIEQQTGSYRGSLYGIASNNLSSSFQRHPFKTKDHKGLFFCGGGAHPGGGMPLVILSGKNAAKGVMREYPN